MKQIYFKCPSCRRSCVVEAHAAGYLAPCPHCGAKVRIPSNSGLPPQYKRWIQSIALNVVIAVGLAAAGIYVVDHVRSRPVPVIPSAPARPPVAASAPVPATGAAEAERQEWTQERERLNRENESVRVQFEKLGNWVLKNFRGKYPLPEKMVSRLRLVPVTDDFRLQPDIAELLQVTPNEKSLVDDALSATWHGMSDLETSLLSITESVPGKVTLYVPPYAEQGQNLREDLYAALETTLGASRFDRFMDVANEDLQKSYHYFGEASRTVIFEVTTPQDTRLPKYLVIKDGWIIPEGPSSRAYKVTESAVNELPKPYLAYLNFLPEDVAAYAR